MRNTDRSQLIVVTGGAGFIGSQLAIALLEDGLSPQHLLVVDDPAAFQTRNCCKTLRSLSVPVLSAEDFLSQLEKIAAPSAIFHMGASSSTEEMRVDYLKKVNIDYSEQLWNHCTKQQIPFIYASSAATYGDGQLGFDDKPEFFSQLKPLNPYGQSKLIFDKFVCEQISAQKTPPRWAGFRFFNVYGPGEEHKGSQASVLWTAMKQISSAGKIRLFQSHNPKFKDGEQQRDFIWVGDITKTLIAFWKHSYKNGIYNLGTGQARTFKDLAQAVATAMNVKVPIEFIPTPEHLREHYQYFTQANLERLRASGYQFQPTPLEQGIAQSVSKIIAGNT